MVQSIGTDGQLFQFMVFQLNTTDLVSNDGVKNLVWIDSDQNLYERAQCVPEVKKGVVTVRRTWEMVVERLPFHHSWGSGSWHRAAGSFKLAGGTHRGHWPHFYLSRCFSGDQFLSICSADV